MLKPKLQGKHWEKEFEKPIYELFKKNKIYKFNKNTKKPIYSIDTPPPYVNAPVHIGQATTYVLMDMFARFKRMLGYEVLFPLGLDKNGLPIEMAAEKRFKIKLHNTPREKFLKLCKKILEESSTASLETFLRSGISFNSWKIGKDIGEVYETDSQEYRKLTQSTFIDLWNKGLIYEDKRINNYCPGCQTTLADAEIEYANLSSIFNDVKFKVKETGETLIISTTRPELICTCAMIIYNPKDSRYKHLKNKTAITPIYNKEIPIKPHPMAKIDETTSGLVMMCAIGDTSDLLFFREQNLKPVIAIDIDGKMNKHAGFLKGLTIKEAREKIIDELKKQNLLTKQQKIMHRTPICERSKDPIEFIALPEFYLKQLKFKKDMKRLAKKINFFAPRSRQILLNWIDSITMDWAISRRRYYATEIPLWYCKKCNEIIVPKKGKYYQPWKEPPPIKKCKCGSTEFRGETRVFDTWMDSSITPLYILGYSRYPKFFKKTFPCTLRPSGKEILRSWGYYTILRCFQLTNKCIFKDHWVNYHIVDEKGYKMSKSKGNIIDPKNVLDEFGAEPFRLWCAVEGNLTKTDFRCSFERIKGATKTLIKLWNVAKFISMFPIPKKPKFTDLDKWILNELNALIKFSKKQYEEYDFHNPVIKIKHFIWETFASHYLELAKNRAYNKNNEFTKQEQNAACYTLHYCLDNILKLLAPVIPLMTYKIYKELKNKDIHSENFPKQIKEYKIKFTTKDITELNSKIWKAKQDKNLSLKAEIKKLTLPLKFKSIQKDLKSVTSAKEIKFANKLQIKF